MASTRHAACFEIDQPAPVLFPLFSPEGEKLWVPGWDYRDVMGETALREDYVFLTRGHDHAAGEAIWVVKRYLPEDYLVSFYKVEPGVKLGIIEVRCFEIDRSRTRVQVSYEYVGLSAAGDEFVSAFSRADYEDFIGEWRKLLVNWFDSDPASP